MPERHDFSAGFAALEELLKACLDAEFALSMNKGEMTEEDKQELVRQIGLIQSKIALLTGSPGDAGSGQSGADLVPDGDALPDGTGQMNGKPFLRSHRPRDGALDFILLESVRFSQHLKKPLQRQKHLDIAQTFRADINLKSIPPKLGKWRGDEILSWIDRSPHTVKLAAGGLRRMKELYEEAEQKAGDITRVLQEQLDEGYSFPALNDLR